MPRPSQPPLDPAQDAAALLRRVGFALLMIVVPTSALVTRRAVVILVPIAIALLVIAAALDGTQRPVGPALERLARSRGGLAGALVLAWCALSLLWTPFTAPAAERLLNIALTVALAVAGYLSLPDRMRSANLYLLPVGVGAGALMGIALALFAPDPGAGAGEDGSSLQRGLVVLSLFLWPAVAWLHSRGRQLEALALAVLAAVAVALGPDTMPMVALGVGAVVFAMTVSQLSLGVRIAGIAMGALLALAPLIPLLLQPLAALASGPQSPNAQSLEIWRDTILRRPARLVTGHGFETALRGRFVGRLPVEAPRTLLFEVWYELGVVGALAGAAAIHAAMRGLGRGHPALVPGAAAAFATAFAFACLGIGTALTWWFTALATVVLLFTAAERGQFRTKRPKAQLMAAANDA